MTGLILIGASSAAPYVVAEASNADEAQTVVAAHLSVPAPEVIVLRPSAVRARTPWSDAGGVVTCQGPPSSREDVQAALAAGRSGFLAFDYDKAQAALQDAEGHVVCATDPADRDLLWDLFVLKGVVAVNLQDPDAARRPFRTARNLAPDAGWDTRYGDGDGRDLFEAVDEDLTSRVRLVPAPDRLLLDGAEVELDLPILDLSTGQHLLQFGSQRPLDQTLLFDPSANNPNLVVPALVPADPVEWTDPGLAGDLSTVLAGKMLPDDAELWVVTETALLHAAVDTLDWTRVERPAPAVPEASRDPEPVRWPRAVAVGAGVTVGGGAAGLGATYLWSRDLKVQMEAAGSDAAFTSLEDTYTQVRTWNQVSGAIVVTSAVTALGAVLLDRHQQRRGPRRD